MMQPSLTKQDAVRACQLALGVAQELAGIAVDWGDHACADLGPDQVERVSRLMLVGLAHRSAVAWPAQLLRLPQRRWPASSRPCCTAAVCR